MFASDVYRTKRLSDAPTAADSFTHIYVTILSTIARVKHSGSYGLPTTTGDDAASVPVPTNSPIIVGGNDFFYMSYVVTAPLCSGWMFSLVVVFVIEGGVCVRVMWAVSLHVAALV